LIETNEYREQVAEFQEKKRKKIEDRIRKKLGSAQAKIEIEKIMNRENQVAPETLVKGKPNDPLVEAGILNFDDNSNIVTQQMEGSVNIYHWDILFDMYINRHEFSEHKLFEFIFQQIILWKILSKYSKKHAVVLTEIFKESKELFDSDRISKYSEGQVEKASIFKFIKKIMLELEVVDQEKKLLMIYYPKKPECFHLSNEDKKNYMEDCDISDSNTKMLDIQRNFKMFCI
jgi:hypothetical protein